MTPKKKAKELVLKYQFYVTTWDCYNDEPLELKYRMPHMKECALIAVDNILIILNDLQADIFIDISSIINYYLKVKQEIKKL